MSTKRFRFQNRDRFAHCVRHDGEQDVQSGLAMTPSQVMKMAEKGLPITTRNLGITYDEGYSQLDFDPPLEHRRGVDIGDLFEARMDSKAKLRGLRNSGQLEYAAKLNQEGAAH